nr:unnamed protein product [Spirometra erinaceieuropaei]
MLMTHLIDSSGGPTAPDASVRMFVFLVPTADGYGYDWLNEGKISPKQYYEAGVDTVCLADTNTTLSKKDKCYVVGWGDSGAISPCPPKGILRRHRRGGPHGLFGRHYASFGCRHSRFLRQRKAAGMAPSLGEAKVTLTSPKKCARWSLNPDKEHLICAGGVSKAVCTNDKGSGLYCHNAETDRWFLHGIIGHYWGHRCSESYRLFSSVSSVSAWIHQHIR